MKQRFDDNTADYVDLHDMFVEDGFFRIETYCGRNWQFDDDFYRSSFHTEDGDLCHRWYGRGSGDEIPFSEVLVGIGITEERFFQYEAITEKLLVRQITKEDEDIVFCIRSHQLFAFDYVIEIMRTQEELAGTMISSLDGIVDISDEDYYLPLGDDWYLHYRNYLHGDIEPRPRHPNGAKPLSY